MVISARTGDAAPCAENGDGGILEAVRETLIEHLKQIRCIHEQDRTKDTAGVYVPEALERKYHNLGKEWGWFWVFPSHKLSVDPRTGIIRRHFKYPGSYQRAIKEASNTANITKRISSHTLRHSFATHLLEPAPTSEPFRNF